VKIKSHPTLYAGTLFRSRLEATWAAFFDLSGLPWAYEPIDLEGWVPDFALWLNHPVYVEVKPAPLSQSLALLDVAVLQSNFGGFDKARAHQGDVCVLLLGMRPNDDADYFGIGTLLDLPPADRSPIDRDGLDGMEWYGPDWLKLHSQLKVVNARKIWGAALAATQWVPA
jgi:hypothetical protein